jgi:hypothetical protein
MEFVGRFAKFYEVWKWEELGRFPAKSSLSRGKMEFFIQPNKTAALQHELARTTTELLLWVFPAMTSTHLYTFY